MEVSRECLQSWTCLVDDANETNWVLWTLVDGRPPMVKLFQTGTGGLTEMRECLTPTECLYGGLLVQAVDEKQGLTSVRNRYVCFVFAGKQAPILKKARLSSQKGLVFAKMPNVSVSLEFIGADPSQLSNTRIANELLACGGAHKPTHYDFGDGTRYDILDFHSGEGTSEDRNIKPTRRVVATRKPAVETPKAEIIPEPTRTPSPTFPLQTTSAAASGTPTKPPPTELYHKSCFKCSHCNKLLTLGNYASMNNKIYCKPHAKLLSADKGSAKNVKLVKNLQLLQKKSAPSEQQRQVWRKNLLK
ncbi:hypothetical protein Pelo_16722 [Pelomyxa schiedti]|nr:hypothetical protein Pelo_16722 [Pelomyxa schiedti]